MNNTHEKWSTGYVQVYTGNGKGKTTAMLGLTVRAVGAGLRVFIAQFVKGMKYSELEALRRFDDLVTVKQYGRDCFIVNEPTDEDIRVARQGLNEVRDILYSDTYDIVVLDEANIATWYKLFSVDELIELIENKPKNVELIITGRNADERILQHADLVTEMREYAHYYTKGVEARIGIEW